MMRNKQRVEVVLLCEDKQHGSFVREYLRRSKFKARIMRTISLSDGSGSGEQMVRENYRTQVDLYRNRSAKGKGGVVLMAVVDADNLTVQNRIDQLERTLDVRRRLGEKIAIIVPRRNIETWIEYALEGMADEKNDYKRFRQTSAECKEAAKQFAEKICPAGLPEDAPPSLFTACEELNRIL